HRHLVGWAAVGLLDQEAGEGPWHRGALGRPGPAWNQGGDAGGHDHDRRVVPRGDGRRRSGRAPDRPGHRPVRSVGRYGGEENGGPFHSLHRVGSPLRSGGGGVRGEHLALPEGETTEMPTIEPLVVYRATLRTWLISLAAIPAVVVGVDILWRQRIISWIADLVYESDPESIDLRDEVWAWVLVVVGGAVLVWGLKELFWPAPVLRTDDEGIHVRMNGPFRPPVTLPWLALHDVDAGTLEDDAEEHDVL